MIWSGTTIRRPERDCGGNAASSVRRVALRAVGAVLLPALRPALTAAQNTDGTEPAWQRMPLEVRARLLVFLVVVLFLGLVAVMLIRMTGRIVRLYADGSKYQSTWVRTPVDSDDWASKPLVNWVDPDDEQDEQGMGRSSDDT